MKALSDYDKHLFAEGKHYSIYKHLGAHVEKKGVRFAVWAPNARSVSVIGDFNGWNKDVHKMEPVGSSGVWQTTIAQAAEGHNYKYAITSHVNNYYVEKSDPVGFAAEVRPKTASKVTRLDSYKWNDQLWMKKRGALQGYGSPVSIYEIHLGSWMRGDGNWLGYRDMADKLAAYVKEMGFTHVEFLPVSEHPLDASWGYQTVGLYSPTSRYGNPDDLRYLIDKLHQNNIGVILDWVPAHFPKDQHGLSFFDGTHLYEHEDPRKGEQQDWGTLIYNFARNEVQSFLISNALYWFEEFHIDGLRVDAVASMLYLDYSRKEGQWIPNEYGGNENLEALEFLRTFNEEVYARHPDCMTIAEESTSWGGISRPTYTGGVGFGYKWDMGWMHDTLSYFSKDPIHRKYHQNQLSFRTLYANTENFVLPISHDEVVHGKASLISKMPGDFKEKFANTRALLGYMYGQTGKKLLFMGCEFGMWNEWSEDKSIDWHLLDYPEHKGLQSWVRDLNNAYSKYSALHHFDCSPEGFSWIDCSDSTNSVYAWIRKGAPGSKLFICIGNFTPVHRQSYRIGVPKAGFWKEILNSDAECYGGGGCGNFGGVNSEENPWHGCENSILLSLPPSSVIYMACDG